MNQNTLHKTFSAAECADRTGLTIRALRLYERHGLIKPHRTAKNWRLYGAKEIERLNEIIILKRFGLSLSRIAELLAGKLTDIESILAAQADTLIDQRKRADASLAIIAKLRGELSSGGASVSTLIELAKEMTMTEAIPNQTPWKRYEQARPRNSKELTADVLNDYSGFYRLDGATIITIIASKTGIDIALTGQPFIPLHPEAKDTFFSKQMALQFTFERDEVGAVQSLTLHQSGLERPASRISADEANIVKQALEARLSGKIPLPSSERTLRTIIAEAQEGLFDETRFSSELAQAVRDQMPIIGTEFAKLGAMKALSFKGVAQDGWDVYDVKFEYGEQKWRIYMPDDQTVTGLFFQPNL